MTFASSSPLSPATQSVLCGAVGVLHIIIAPPLLIERPGADFGQWRCRGNAEHLRHLESVSERAAPLEPIPNSGGQNCTLNDTILAEDTVSHLTRTDLTRFE